MAKRARSDAQPTERRDSGSENGDGGNPRQADGDAKPADSGDTGFVVEPGSIVAETDAGSDSSTDRKRRSDAGRKRGPRAKAPDQVDLGSVAETISEIHSFLAFLTGVREFALDEAKEEHIKIARGLERVARHYDIPAIREPYLSWFLLFKTLGFVYGAHYHAYSERMRSEHARDVTPRAAVPAAPNAPQAKSAPQARTAKVVVPGFEHVGAVEIKLN